MSPNMLARLRLHTVRATLAYATGFTAAASVLIVSNYQSDFGLPGLVVVSPLFAPLIVLAVFVVRDRRRAIFDRVLGPVVFVGFAYAGEALLAYLLMRAKYG